MPRSSMLEAKSETLELLAVKNSQGMAPFMKASNSSSQSSQQSILGVGAGDNVVRIYVAEGASDTVLDSLAIRLERRRQDVATEYIRTPGFKIPSPPNRSVATGVPIQCGQSCGHVAITAGTIGCLVSIVDDSFILSNNHVLADTNAAHIGDAVVHPGPIDGGTSPRDDVGTLSDFERISFIATDDNEMDAAIARIVDGKTVSAKVTTVGFPTNTTATSFVGQEVKKHGRTTGYTEGEVVDVSFDGFVDYGGQSAWFVNQIVVQPTSPYTIFSEGGDSGSLIVEKTTNNPTALLFAGNSQMTLGNPFDIVRNRFAFNVIDHD